MRTLLLLVLPACAARVAPLPAPTVEVALGAARLEVATTEVTRAQWLEHAPLDPSSNPRCPDCPVETVSWYDAVSWANARSAADGLGACYVLDGCVATAPRSAGVTGRETGLRCESVTPVPGCDGWRLPTREEWAALAPLGADALTRREVTEHAVWSGNANDRPWRVAGRAPNPLGLYDTVGNVDEWLENPAPPPEKARKAPAEDPRWYATAATCYGSSLRAVRDANDEVEAGSWGRSCLGFRVVRTLPPAGP